MKTLDQLLAALPEPHFGPRLEIAGITDDSRQVKPGWLFVAYRGVEADGHKYIPDAVRRGAAAVVCERPWPDDDARAQIPRFLVPNGREAFAWLCAAFRGFPGRSLVMIGVTGTDGKTTTTNLVFNILKAAGIRAGMISTVNAVIGERVLDTGLHTTTPDADEVQEYLAAMRDAGLTHCVLEVTSHGLAHYRVDGCDFDVGAVTNITHEHLDLHGSREAYRAAKGRLFEMLGAPRDDGRRSALKPAARAAVLNADDPYSFDYLRAMPVARRLAYSLADERAEVFASDVAHEPGAMRIDVRTPDGAIRASSALIGDYNASNILAAVGVGVALGLPADAIERGVASLGGVPGRMERIDAGQAFTAIVDFAHTPNALDQCLRSLRRIARGRVICVFGCAGERDRAKRPMMAAAAAQLGDVAVFTAEDPRRESLDDIFAQMDAGVAALPAAARRAAIHHIRDRAEAIRFACAMARAGDVVVACGKGHEQSMCFGTTEHPWDDRTAMREAIGGQTAG